MRLRKYNDVSFLCPQNVLSSRRMCSLLYTQFKIRILRFKTSNMVTTARQPASLLTLPAELRNEIYNYVAIEHEESINAGIAFASENCFQSDV